MASKVPIVKMLHRLNEYIEKLSPAAKSGTPLTLEDAIQASFACSKCHVTKSNGTKGCSQCMGPFFQPLRVRAKKDLHVTSPRPDTKG